MPFLVARTSIGSYIIQSQVSESHVLASTSSSSLFASCWYHGLIIVNLLAPPGCKVSPPLQNITMKAQNGTSSHGDPHLLRIPSIYLHISILFLANFVTVKSLLGESTRAMWLALLGALLLPVSGVVRGTSAVCSLAMPGTTPLETAAKTGALCMAVRSDNWEPNSGDKIKKPKIIFLSQRRVPIEHIFSRDLVTSEEKDNRYRVLRLARGNRQRGMSSTTLSFTFQHIHC